MLVPQPASSASSLAPELLLLPLHVPFHPTAKNNTLCSSGLWNRQQGNAGSRVGTGLSPPSANIARHRLFDAEEMLCQLVPRAIRGCGFP